MKNLFNDLSTFIEIESCVYGEKGVKVLTLTKDLLVKGHGMLRFVLYSHPIRGNMILVSTDLTLSASDILRIYGLRFKIEVAFKSAIYTLGAFVYRFWMKTMKKTRRGDGTKHLHKDSEEYREIYLKKLRAYNLYVQLGMIAQGIMQCLSILHSKEVWASFGSWIRTIRPGILPSEMVVSMALRNNLFYFLTASFTTLSFQKFLKKKIDFVRAGALRKAG